MAEASYYARGPRSAWREAQLREAAERERRRREADPEGFRQARREATRRCRAWQMAHGLTFDELARRCLMDTTMGYGLTRGTENA